MKFQEAELANIEGMETRAFGINFNSHVAKLMSDNVYEDKPLAVVREICTNAWDANADVPFKVTLPTDFSDRFIVRDFGPGMSEDQIYDLYSTFFASGSLGKDDKVGGFGLGSKAPLALVDSFKVTSYQAGVAKTYLIFKDGAMPTVAEPVVSETTEPDGLEVDIEIPILHQRRVREYTAAICFNLKTTDGLMPTVPEFMIEEYKYKEELRVPFKNGYRFMADSEEPTVYNKGGITVMLMGVTYPIVIARMEIELKVVDILNKEFKSSHSDVFLSDVKAISKDFSAESGIQIEMQSGEVFPSLSREALSLEGDAVDRITDRIARAYIAESMELAIHLRDNVGNSVLEKLYYAYIGSANSPIKPTVPIFGKLTLKGCDFSRDSYGQTVRVSTIKNTTNWNQIYNMRLASDNYYRGRTDNAILRLTEALNTVQKVVFVYAKSSKSDKTVENRMEKYAAAELLPDEEAVVIELYDEHTGYAQDYTGRLIKSERNVYAVPFDIKGEPDAEGWHTTTLAGRNVKCKLMSFYKFGKESESTEVKLSINTPWEGKTVRLKQTAGSPMALPTKEEFRLNLAAAEKGKKLDEYLVVFSYRTLTRVHDHREAVRLTLGVNAAIKTSGVEMYWKAKFEPVRHAEIVELRKFRVFAMIEKDFSDVFGWEAKPFSTYLKQSYLKVLKAAKKSLDLPKEVKALGPLWLVALLSSCTNGLYGTLSNISVKEMGTGDVVEDCKNRIALGVYRDILHSGVDPESLRGLLPKASRVVKDITTMQEMRIIHRNTGYSLIEQVRSIASILGNYSEAEEGLALAISGRGIKDIVKSRNFGKLVRKIITNGPITNGPIGDDNPRFGTNTIDSLRLGRSDYSEGSQEAKQATINSILMMK